MKRNILISVLLCLALLSGCAQKTTAPEASAEPQITQQPTETPESSSSEEIAAPTHEEVEAARALALEGMKDADIQRLTEIIVGANQYWESRYLYTTTFDALANPDDLQWNIFHQTGEVQIGWSIPEDLDADAICASEHLTYGEFCEKYGSKVVQNNEYNADMFIDLLSEVQGTVQNAALKADLQSIMDETALARDTHSFEHVNNLFKTLHDMDYYLLRYGLDLYEGTGTDMSLISIYYGTLSIYQS